MRRALRVHGLTPAQKLLVVALASFDGRGGIWPSVATLAELVGVSTRQVQRLLGELVELGVVSVERNAGGVDQTRSDRRPNRYVLALDDMTPASPRDHDHDLTPTSPRGYPQRDDTDVTPSDHGVTWASERGDMGVRTGRHQCHPNTSEKTQRTRDLILDQLTRGPAELDEDEPDQLATRRRRIAECAATLKAEARPDIGNRPAWIATTTASILTDHGARIDALLDEFADAPDAVIANAAVNGSTPVLGYYRSAAS